MKHNFIFVKDGKLLLYKEDHIIMIRRILDWLS